MMYLPKLFVHVALALGMFVRITFTILFLPTLDINYVFMHLPFQKVKKNIVWAWS